MATLNLQTTSSIIGKTTTVNLSTTSATSLLSNESSSGFVYKVRSIIVANAGVAAANITVAYYSASALGGTAYPIVSTVSIPASGVLPILDSNTFIYMPDDSSIGVTASTANYLTVTCAYEQVTASAIPSVGPVPGTAGTLWAWGTNNYGQLGQNDKVYRSSPTQVGSLATWSKIATGRMTAAIKSDGTLWVWGSNNGGELGQNDRAARSSPVQVGALTNWSKVKVTGATPVLIKTDGTMWTMGSNSFGALGLNDTVSRSSPTQIGALTTWSVPNSASAIKTDGTLWIWGTGYAGRWGINTSTGYRSSPVQLGALTDWSIITGYLNCLAIKTDGTMWSWGQNTNGQLGKGDTIKRSSPVQVGALTNWSNVAYKQSGAYACFAIKTDGSLWSWGRNYAGHLGQNNTTYRSSPVQVGSDTNWSYVTLCTALKTDGTMWSWGPNYNGQVGDNTIINRSSPVQIGSATTWQITINDSAFNNKVAIKT